MKCENVAPSAGNCVNRQPNEFVHHFLQCLADVIADHKPQYSVKYAKKIMHLLDFGRNIYSLTIMSLSKHVVNAKECISIFGNVIFKGILFCL